MNYETPTTFEDLDEIINLQLEDRYTNNTLEKGRDMYPLQDYVSKRLGVDCPPVKWTIWFGTHTGADAAQEVLELANKSDIHIPEGVLFFKDGKHAPLIENPDEIYTNKQTTDAVHTFIADTNSKLSTEIPIIKADYITDKNAEDILLYLLSPERLGDKVKINAIKNLFESEVLSQLGNESRFWRLVNCDSPEDYIDFFTKTKQSWYDTLKVREMNWILSVPKNIMAWLHDNPQLLHKQELILSSWWGFGHKELVNTLNKLGQSTEPTFQNKESMYQDFNPEESERFSRGEISIKLGKIYHNLFATTVIPFMRTRGLLNTIFPSLPDKYLAHIIKDYEFFKQAIHMVHDCKSETVDQNGTPINGFNTELYIRSFKELLNERLNTYSLE